MRMIDADRMLSQLRPITYDMEQNAVTIADMSNIMRDWVRCQPTIPAPQWISVKDRLPHNADEVLIYFSDGIVISGDYFDAVGFIPEHFYDGNGKISHWMPLPEPPKEDVQ